MDQKPVGYQAISQRLNLCTVPHYRQSFIAAQGRGKTIIDNHHEIHIYPKSYALKNEDDLLEHLEFSIKYDGINLEIIQAIFTKIEVSRIVDYIQNQPTGIYSRKVWYLYEFIMGDQLPFKDCRHVKYADLLDPKLYYTSPPIRSTRHAINNNLLGNNKFCPIVRRTGLIENYINLHLDVKVKALIDKYDPHLIARACNYLYTKETMSSYQIEREQPDKSRIIRFINLLQQTPNIDSMSKEKLIELQNAIVDPRFKDVDYRKTQNYVGQNIDLYLQKIHYVSPKPKNVPEIMQGLLDSLERMLLSGVHPVIVAAAISFGFVFIHPFEDGNGRIHRFLIHYILSKAHFTPGDMIFPVSSVMLKNMREYDSVLESFSKPLLSVITDYKLTDDGVMTVKQETKTFYQYIDFTVMVEYLFSCIDDAIHNQIEREIIFLVNYDRAKNAIQAIVDMPDNQIDLFIKFIIQNNGSLSGKKRNRYFELLTDDEVNRITEIVKECMMGD